MRFSPRSFALLVTLVLAVGPRRSGAQVLYDPALGTPPDAQGWSYLYYPLAPATGVANGQLQFDSTLTNSIQAGYGLTAATPLDRGRGFSLAFSLRLQSEGHSGNANRAGFALIALGADKRGIELGFWTTSIWAQADSPLFTRAEAAAFVTTNGFVDYVLSLGATHYTLFANGTAILNGPIRNYTAFQGFPDPYETPNFLFFGDNTSSAQAAWSLRSFSLIQPPTMEAAPGGVVSWTGVSNQAYGLLTSTNLSSWHRLTNVTSTTDTFRYTNQATRPAQVYRAVFP